MDAIAIRLQTRGPRSTRSSACLWKLACVRPFSTPASSPQLSPASRSTSPRRTLERWLPRKCAQEPRPYPASDEARRASLRSHSPLDDERGEVARLHQIARELDHYSGVPVIKAAIGWLDGVGRQEPPPGVDAGRWVCADEAYYLVDTLCVSSPTGYRGGLFVSNRGAAVRSTHWRDDGRRHVPCLLCRPKGPAPTGLR